MEDNLKRKLCNKLISEGKVKEGDVIRHSYSNSRMRDNRISNNESHDCSPTLDTRCDCLGVVVKDRAMKAGEGSGSMLKVIESEPKINVVGNYKPSGHSCGRVITSDGITPTVMENHGAVQTIVENKENNMENTQVPNYRIRKLTPKECFRLMGIKDSDFEKVAENQSNASLYHLAGDSIVTTCMMGIFGELFNVPDYRDKIENLLKGLN